MSRARVRAAAVVAVSAWMAACSPAWAQQRRTVRLTPLQAMRLLAQQGDYEKVKRIALAEVWSDISKPEALRYLVVALERLHDREQAGAFCHILLRVLEQRQTASAPSTPAIRKWAQAQLPRLDVEFRKRQKRYRAAAAGKKFTTAEDVSDLWMTQVTSDAHCLHGLYAWKLVGGRKDLKPDWIHNRLGSMHRSCMKHVEEVEGRKGVLFSIPVKVKTSKDADKFHRALLKRLGHPTQITIRNVGKCRFLRAGTRAYGFPFIFRVEVGGKELLAQRVGTGAWSDLKIDLGDAAGRDVSAIVELIVPEGQRWSEGAWIDYLDFFDD